MKTTRHSVFPNGTSFMCWLDRNCDRCRKGPSKAVAEGDTDNGLNPLCSIESAIALSSCLDGTLDDFAGLPPAAEIMRRLNWDGESYLEHDCPEREPIAQLNIQEEV